MKTKKLPSDSRAIGTSSAITSFGKFNSGARAAMAASQISQMVGVSGYSMPHVLTGYEGELIKFTNAVKMPADGSVIGVVCKYQTGRAKESIKRNSLKTVIFLNEENGELSMIDIPSHTITHDIFGHILEETPIVRSLRRGMGLAKGTILAKSPTDTDEGIYVSGIEAETCYMSDPAVIEDGVKVSESFAEKARPYSFSVASGEWGSKRYPVNTFGDERVYKPFPSPGENIREDGLVFALRSYDELFDAIDMLPEMLNEPDLIYDQCTYAPVESSDVIVLDVDVITTTQDNNRLNLTPVGMEAYASTYTTQRSHYFKTILDICEDFKAQNRNCTYSKSLHRLLVMAYGDKPKDRRSRYGSVENRSSVRRTKRGVPLDEWNVNIQLQWKFKTGLGAKITGLAGNKGVFCKISPDAEMPHDEFGNRADVVIYGPGVVARTNPGQLYEQFINACIRDVSKDIRGMLNTGVAKDVIWDYMMNWMKVASEETYAVNLKKDLAGRESYLDRLIDDDVYIVVPDDASYTGLDWVRELMRIRMPDKGPVTFTNFNGEPVTTEVPVLIGKMNWIVLDKSAFHPMQTCVSKLNTFGLPSPLNRATKHASPVTLTPPRVYAESECRGIITATGGEALMDTIELSTCPEATEMAITRQFTDEKPSQMRDVIDRSVIPYGSGRNVSIVKHLLESMGTGIGLSK